MPSKIAAEPYAARRAAGAASREATRGRLLVAADHLFRRDGFAATTVSAIAAEAGVSMQTLYLAWGSKAALFRAAADAAATASDIPLEPDDWRSRIDLELKNATGPDPSARDYLAQTARIFATVAERSSTYWKMQPAAAAADPDTAAGFAATMTERRHTMEHVAARIPQSGRRGLPSAYVADTLWTLASPETYALLTSAGHSTASYAQWLSDTLIAALCTPTQT